MQSVSPALLAISSYVRAVRYPDGAIVNGTGAAETGYTTSAAAGQGDILEFYGTGFGPTDPAVSTGLVFTGAYPTTNAVTVTIGGIAAEVLWAGLVAAGVYQINVRVPASVSDGDQPVVAMAAGLASQSGVILKVSAAAKLSARIRTNPSRGRGPATFYARTNLARLQWLGGLSGPAQHAEGGSHLARVSLQAAEQQGRILQLA